jgi:hypothetical protein
MARKSTRAARRESHVEPKVQKAKDAGKNEIAAAVWSEKREGKLI